MLQMILPLAVGILLPLVFLVLVRTLDLYASGSFASVLVAFGGGLAAFGGAYFLNMAILQQVNINALPAWLVQDAAQVARLGGIPITFALATLYIAPLVEETLKSLVLVALVRRPDFTYFVDGAIYGFAAGTAFAMLENPYYLITRGGVGGLVLMIGRAFSSSLLHGTASALVGVSLGRLRFGRGLTQMFAIGLGLVCAMTLHSLFNRVAASAGALPSLGLGIGGVVLVALFIFWGLHEQRAWLREKLGLNVGVSKGEKAVVLRMEDLNELLAPIGASFGERKRDQVEEFLRIQAQVGIKSKAMAKMQDEKQREALARQIDELRAQMDRLRREVGIYCMSYVRSIIPPETVNMFESLSEAIDKAESQGPRSDIVFGPLGGKLSASQAQTGKGAGSIFKIPPAC